MRIIKTEVSEDRTILRVEFKEEFDGHTETCFVRWVGGNPEVISAYQLSMADHEFDPMFAPPLT